MEDFTEKEVFRLGLVNSKVGGGGKGISARGEHVQRQGYERGRNQKTSAWLKQRGKPEEKLDRELQARICKAMNGPTREFGLDPVVGKGDPLKNFKQGVTGPDLCFRKPSLGETE